MTIFRLLSCAQEAWVTYADEESERENPNEHGKGADPRRTGVNDVIHRHTTKHQTLQAVMRFGCDGRGAAADKDVCAYASQLMFIDLDMIVFINFVGSSVST